MRDLQAILVHVSRLAALQQAYAGSISTTLARRSRVAYEQAGVLVVVADTGAVAAKLRQLAPRIVNEIVKSVPEINAMKVEVQVTDGPLRAGPRPRIGAGAIRSLGGLRDTLPDSSLRQALSRLLAGARRSDGDDDALEDEEGGHDQR